MISPSPDAAAALVLIVGCRRQLLHAARSSGVRAVVVAGPWERDTCASLFPLAHDVVHVDDATQVDTVLAALRRHGYSQEAFDGFVTASDEYVGVCALLDHLLRGARARSDPWTALTWRDKYLQKTAVSAAGVRVAHSQVIADILAPPRTVDVPFPVVVKPAAGAGAAHTAVVENADDLVPVLRRASLRTPKRTFVVEEFIDGTEYQLDAVVHGGQVAFLSVAQYLVNPLQSLGGGILRVATVDPGEQPDLYRSAWRMVGRSAAALGVVASVLHIEAFRQADGTWVFGECGVRLGGCFTPELVRAKYAIDLAAVELQLSTGSAPRLDVSRVPGVFCRALLPTREGVLQHTLTTRQLLAHPDVHAAEIQHAVGSVLPPPDKNAVTRLGEVVVAGSDLRDVDRRTVSVVEWYLSALEVKPVAVRVAPSPRPDVRLSFKRSLRAD